MLTSDKNILLNQIINGTLKELNPPFSNNINDLKILSFDKDKNIRWSSLNVKDNLSLNIDSSGNIVINSSFNLLENNKLKDTEVYYRDGRIGIGRLPLHTYKIDIGVSKNTQMTAIHIGDGLYGFSFGNATNKGFIPEIIGMGSDENPSLYFLGKQSSPIKSNIPLIIIDGRQIDNSPLKNRPIFGITSGEYDKFKFLINYNGNVGLGKLPGIYKMEIDGILKAKDIILDSSISLKQEIEYLKTQIKILQEK